MSTFRRALCATAFAIVASAAQAAPFSNLFVFGDSLSDSGNIALLTPVRESLPIPGNAYIPSSPYSPSGTFSNGTTWVTAFGAALGFTMQPSLIGGTNFAFGGATTSGGAIPSMTTQVAALLGVPGDVPDDALYVLAGGGNNARAALQAIAGGADVPTTIQSVATAYATDIVSMILALDSQGAEEFVVWNVPNLGVAPAITAGGPLSIGLGTLTSVSMNFALATALQALPTDIRSDIRVFDLFGLTTAISVNPAGFGLTNATQACAANLATCDPNRWLFWDGIHPTSGGHAVIADRMLALVPVPATLPLMAIGVVALWGLRRRRD
jgi:outer membrane lipase/esterase